MGLRVLVCFLLLAASCSSRSVSEEEEDSVVSIYTTVPTAVSSGTHLDVYQQIANNIAQRITSPIYRFLGIGHNKTTTPSTPTTKKPWEKIELSDPVDVAQKDLKPIQNEITEERDVEELSVEALMKPDRKPEKITLYSSYLPVEKSLNLEVNNTINEISDDDDDDSFGLDDVDDVSDDKPREGGFVYFLEWIGSLIQLAWGALSSIFSPARLS